jgi:Holliday junction resolvasome RuvABC endonuclease subunit
VEGKKTKIITFGVIHLAHEKEQHIKLKEIYLQLQEIIAIYAQTW